MSFIWRTLLESENPGNAHSVKDLMELRLLRYFAAVAEELNVTRAAEKLHTAQPSLSQQIRQLEGLIGAPLFLRDKHRLKLTETGRVLLPAAKDILASVEKALMQARATALTQRAATSVILTPVSYSGPGVSRTFKYPVTWQGKAAGDSQIKIDFDERGSYDVTNNTNLAICVAPSVPDARVDSVVVFSLGNHLGKLTLGGTCDSGHITVQ